MNPTLTTPFQTFWMAGFECADHVNKHGDRVDLLTATGHLEHLAEDYRRVRELGISTVREGIRWSVVARQPGVFHWDTVAAMMAEASRQGIQQIWDLCHFGFPDYITPLHPHFATHFVALCEAFVRFYRSVQPDGLLLVTPINEVSFLSWLGGEACGTAPFCKSMGWDVKYHLMRAYIQGIRAMRALDSGVRIITTEPLVNVVPPEPTEAHIAEARAQHEEQYQAMDMLCGYICPELGGSPDLVDVMGFNFYYSNQWLTGYQAFLPWANEEQDSRWRPLRDLLAEAYRRYGIPVALTETSHPGEDRPHWLRFVAGECAAAIGDGVPLLGACLYPIIDRPDWDFPQLWHRSGLWDWLHEEEHPERHRVLHEPYAAALRDAQGMIDAAQNQLMQTTQDVSHATTWMV